MTGVKVVRNMRLIDRIKTLRWIIYLLKVVGWLAFSILAHFDKLGDFPYRHMFAVTAFIIFLNTIGELLNEIFD